MRYTGPLGKAFSGDKQRAMELQSRARVVVGRLLYALKRQGGTGQQYGTERQPDGSVIHAMVMRMIAGQEPIIRTWIESPLRVFSGASGQDFTVIYKLLFGYNTTAGSTGPDIAAAFIGDAKLDTFKLISETSENHSLSGSYKHTNIVHPERNNAKIVDRLVGPDAIFIESLWEDNTTTKTCNSRIHAKSINIEAVAGLSQFDDSIGIYDYRINYPFNFCGTVTYNDRHQFRISYTSKYNLSAGTASCPDPTKSSRYLQLNPRIDVHSKDGVFLYTVDLPELINHPALPLPEDHCLLSSVEPPEDRYRQYIYGDIRPIADGFLTLTRTFDTVPGAIRVCRVSVTDEEAQITWVTPLSANKEIATWTIVNPIPTRAQLRYSVLSNNLKHYVVVYDGGAVGYGDRNIIVIGSMETGLPITLLLTNLTGDGQVASAALTDKHLVIATYIRANPPPDNNASNVIAYSLQGLLNGDVVETARRSGPEMEALLGAPPLSHFFVRSNDMPLA